MGILEALTNKIKQKEDLIKVYKKDNKKSISFSTLNTVETCYRLYKFQYVDKVTVESDNIYTYLGSKAHSIIEQLYRGEINNKQAIKLWDDNMNNTSLLFVNYDKIENEEVKKDLKIIISKIKNKDLYDMISEIRKSDKEYRIILVDGIEIITDTLVSVDKYDNAYRLYIQKLKNNQEINYMDIRFKDVNVK